MRKLLLLIPLLAMAGCGHDARPSSSAAAKATATPTADPLAAYSEGVRKYYVGAQLDAADDPNADAEVKYFQPPMPAETTAGDAITLTGSNIGVRLRVTVSGVRTVRAGGKPYTAVDVRLKNDGITVYQGVLQNVVLTRADGKTSGVAKASAACSNGFDGDFYLDVGRSRRGCLLFLADGDPTRLQLALETVPAEAGGIWDLTRG
ncbi:hypothetical protein [Solirubrobacter soli]|uniref:hypothetical protein n=1 Tax=Solirubrobacter soli TaxID=363832 RepID=UPI0004030FC8|nr:hypothetical protein [Solirubrobacter soli]